MRDEKLWKYVGWTDFFFMLFPPLIISFVLLIVAYTLFGNAYHIVFGNVSIS